MSVAIGRDPQEANLTKTPAVIVIRKPTSSKIEDFGTETRPHLPHACCSGEAGHCYPRIKMRT